MEQMIKGDEIHRDILNIIFDTCNERVVVVDENGIITMMSNSYKDFLNEYNPEGKHVTDVIENTRLHIVAKTGVMEVGEIQEVKGSKMISMRIPIKKGEKTVGAIGKAMFKDIGDFILISNKIKKLESELEYYKKEYNDGRTAKYSFEDIVAESENTKAVIDIAKKSAKTDSNILILGESGTGKELFAHAIHNLSSRRNEAFIKVNCAAIPNELLESELFGYDEGAFSGAKKEGKKGKFEMANGGTILLDEIGDMPLSMQAKLLRVLQEKEIERLGSNDVMKIDIRIIASTNKNLEDLIKKNEFREDLYYRLNVVTINIPPLRERKEDIKLLSNKLRIQIENRLGIYVEGFSNEAYEYLENYDWKGNIRELENIIERAINLLDSDVLIKPYHLPSKLTEKKIDYYKKNKSLKKIIEDIEKQMIEDCLIKTEGNKNKTSKILGISRVSLYKKIEKYNLDI